MGVGPEALYEITRVEYKTEPDTIKIIDLIRLFIEYYMPKKTLTTTGEISSGRNRRKTKHWQNSGDSLLKSNFNTISAEEQLISKYMTAITDKKMRDKKLKEKTLELKKIFELVKPNTYEKKNKKKRNTRSSDISKRKTSDHAKQEEPIQRIERFGTSPKTQISITGNADIAVFQTGHHPALEVN